jgi:multiple sugar transport system permease protein
MSDRSRTGAIASARRWPTQVLASSAAYMILALVAALFVLPFAWMLSTALKQPFQVLQYPPSWIPDPVTFANFLVPWTLMPMGRYFFNTAIVAVVVVACQLATASLSAFAFARLRFPGSRVAFLMTLGMMMVPVHVTLIPLFMSVSQLKLANSYSGLVLPFLTTSFGTFLLRQFFLTIPQELVDAGHIDGCSHFRIYHSIFLPLSKTALATLAVFAFMSQWNGFLWPLVVTNTDDMKVWTLGLLNFKGLYGTTYNVLMAGAFIGVVPPFIAFVFLQRYFIEGITLTGIQGR